MKNRTKLALSLTSLIAVTAGIGTAATFAWFTTTRTATVSFSKTNVTFESIKLGVTLDDGSGYESTNTEKTLSITSAALDTKGTTIKDVSGDGTNMFRPVWLADQEGVKASSVTDISGTKANNYVQFTLTVANTGNSNMEVYINKGSKMVGTTVTPADVGKPTSEETAQINSNTVAAHQMRAAFTVKDDKATSDPELRTIWQNAVSSKNTYVNSTTVTGETISTAEYASSVHIKGTTARGNNVAEFTDEINASDKKSAAYLCTTAAGKSSSITVTYWLEGTFYTGADSTAPDGITKFNPNDAIGGNTDLNLNLVGVKA